MSTTDRVPTRIQILAAQGLVMLGKKLNRPVPEDVVRDAEWPLDEAAPYPEDTRSASRR
jgi:hypothetical protein